MNRKSLPSALGWMLGLLVTAGCATHPALKGSPFYTGDYKVPRSGESLDRIPSWPLLYYNAPVTSVLWPLYESIQDESIAVRPFFSVHGLSEPAKREWNVLWPFIQHDAATASGHAGPVFWGEDYAVGFPLWWRFRDAEGVSDLMLPLWWYDREGDRKRFYTLLGGGSSEGAHGSWFAPLLLSCGSYAPDHSSTWLAWPLAHWGRKGSNTSSHLIPFWYRDSESGVFLSLPWCSWRNSEGVNLVVPLLLSGGSADNQGNGSFSSLAGLYSHSWNAEGTVTDELIPFYFYKKDEYLYSLLFGFKNEGEDHFAYYCTPLVGSSRHGPVEKSWAFPAWHRTANATAQTASGHFLWSTWRSGPNFSRGQFFPFWGHATVASDEFAYTNSNTSAMCWLYGSSHDQRASHAESASYLHPFWFQKTTTQATGESFNKKAALLGLFHSKREVTRDAAAPGGFNDYTRKSFMGFAWVSKNLNGDVSVDCFPGVSYDKNKDGFTQTAWLRRTVRWQRAADGKRRLDILGIPVIKD